MEEKIVYKRLIEKLKDYSLSEEKGEKFIMNFNLFELLKKNIKEFLPFTLETKKDILIKRHIYGYYTRIPIVINKNLEDDFLLIKFDRHPYIIIDLRISEIEKDKNKGLYLLQDLREYIQNFPGIELGFPKENVCNILYPEENLLIGKVTLFNKDVEEYYKLKSERIVWEYKSLKVEKVLEEIQLHKNHTHNIDVDPKGINLQLYCFDCRKGFSSVNLSLKEYLKKVPKKYHTEKNRGYKFEKS
jgi:hypothetical protein